jgi:glycyl-tRNA synthetase
MDKDGMADLATDIAEDLRAAGLSVTYDDSGAIGRRYRRQDEVGTPYCVTVDYESLEDNGESQRASEGASGDEPRAGTVTVRERDTTEQKRLPIDGLADRLERLASGELTFADL